MQHCCNEAQCNHAPQTWQRRATVANWQQCDSPSSNSAAAQQQSLALSCLANWQQDAPGRQQ
eukprot:13112788-Alexandrium_andersonii.AAC.1